MGVGALVFMGSPVRGNRVIRKVNVHLAKYPFFHSTISTHQMFGESKNVFT